MAVTTANTLRLSDVCAEIYGSSSTAGKSLMQCHADATGTFNPTYAKTGSTLLDFRGYEHTAALPQLATPAVYITANAANSITITYNAISGANRYRIQVSTSSSFSSATTHYATGTTFVIPNLLEDTYYYIRVQAQNTGTTAPDSDYGYVEGGTGILPTPPTYAVVTGNYIVDTQWVYLKITWSPGQNVDYYIARYRFLGESTWNTYSGIAGTDTSFEYNRYEKNATYEMQLIAVNQYGQAYAEILVVHTAG